jgi:hypothetical protein
MALMSPIKSNGPGQIASIGKSARSANRLDQNASAANSIVVALPLCRRAR